MTAVSAANVYPRGDNEREFTSRNTSLETRSRSPSPNPTPVPGPVYEYYGTANLTDRSRSPSPSSMLPLENAIRKPTARQPPAAPKKPSALNLSPFYVGGNMPHVLPSPTVPQPHKSPGSINFPQLSASPSRGPYEMEWSQGLHGAPSAICTPAMHRSASSEQLSLARGGYYSSRMDPSESERSQNPSQVMHPSSRHEYDPRRPIAHNNWAPSRQQMEKFAPQPAAAYGNSRTREGNNSNTLPRSYRYDQPAQQSGHRGHGVNMTRLTQMPMMRQRHSDSEDEDWC